jgi:hypothetical protein
MGCFIVTCCYTPSSLLRIADPQELRAANEIVKLVRKLRWMGMEDEAERMQMQLVLCSPADSVLAASQQTD